MNIRFFGTTVSSSILLLLSATHVIVSNYVALAGHTGDTCTHGKLYISDTVSSNVHIFALDGSLQNMVEESTITIPNAGPELNLDISSSGEVVAAIYEGTEENFYTDGTVHWIDTNVFLEDHVDHSHIEFGVPSLIQNAALDCTRPIHFIRHNDQMGIFCDGSYFATPQQINSTIWLFDETKFSSTSESPIIVNMTLQGSHHGVAIPVDDDHLLYSVATPERISRNDTGFDYQLPATFHVVNYNGDVIHSIDDTNSSDTSCSGFHGSWCGDNVFVLACDPDHGGFLKVNYDNTTGTYTSRALAYPESYIDQDRKSVV